MVGEFTPCGGLILLVTFIVSLAGFARERIREDYLFDPERILVHREYYRILTSGFLHADWFHLLINLFSFHSFATSIEWVYGPVPLAIIYFAAIIGGNLLSLYLHRNHLYRALGASGGVCGVIFASIFLLPGGGVVMWPVPIPIPAWLYAFLFLAVSYVKMRGGLDNIGHDAHLGGAIIGLLAATVLYPHAVLQSPRLFIGVVLVTSALFWHLLRYPMFLPGGEFFGSKPAEDNHPRYTTTHLKEPREVDRILEKISTKGMQSLTPQEKELLQRRSERLRRRAG